MKEITPAKIAKLDSILAGASKATIVVHVNADGDAIGSGSAMLHYLLEVRGLDAAVAVPDRDAGGSSFLIPEEDRKYFFFFQSEPEKTEERISSSDVIIVQDCIGFSRTEGLAPSLGRSSARKILIDHHIGPESDSFDLVFSKTDISSASEMLFHILMEMPDIGKDASKLPRISGRALMTGMTTDTNNFANSVYPSTFDMASKLIAAGVDRDEILNQLYYSYRESRLRLMGFLMNKMTITPEGVAYMIMTKRNFASFGVTDSDTEGFVNLPLSIKDVRMSVFLKQDTGFFRVSTRSKKGTSAQQFASRYFNGGGHENAAGGRLYFSDEIKSIRDVIAYLEQSINDFFA